MDYSSNSEVTVFWTTEGYQPIAPQRAGLRVQVYLGCEDTQHLASNPAS